MNPYIGIVKGKPGWVQLLKQEGLFYKVYTPGDNPAVLIVDELSEKSEILEYFSEGGFILTDTATLGTLLNERTERVRIDYIIPDTSPFFRNVGIVDIYNRGYILDRKGFGGINNRFPALFEFSYKKGWGIALPFDVSSVILDSSRRTKFFYTKKRRFPVEYVSSVSRGEVRKLVVNALRYLFRKRGLYYIHKWYYPEGKKNGFFFRIDTDKSDFKEILDTYRIAEKNGLSLTFFIDVKSLNDDVNKLKELEKQEIAVHSFEHRIFKVSLKNRENFSKAKELLCKEGIETKGIAVPYGFWNSPLGFTIEELGFLYSSEFSYSYDDLPSFPYIETRFSNVLQIPVHPISPGTLLYVKNNVDDIKSYFERIIQEKYASDEPLSLYGHSGVFSNHPSILEHIINAVKSKKGIWFGTYGDFYEWWRERENSNPEILFDGSILKMKGIEENFRLTLQIITPEGKRTIVPLKKEVNLKELNFTEMSKTRAFDKNKLQVKQRALKLKLKEMENWIRR